MLSIHPEAATTKDVAMMSAELMECVQIFQAIVDYDDLAEVSIATIRDVAALMLTRCDGNGCEESLGSAVRNIIKKGGEDE